ncbi:MAG: DUF4136 domain-containing protein [Verrucomicrobia bacterium]|nr:DUF4136 domain-containing protein [Verrucomicrobiota bacterium]
MSVRVAISMIVLACTGCMLRIWSQHDPAYDFSDVQSFAWLRPGEVRSPDAPLASDALDALVRKCIADEMTASGYVESDRMHSQVLLDYRAALEKRKDVVPLGHNPDNNTARDIEDYDRGTEHGPRSGIRFAANDGWAWAEAEPESYERHYEEGTLIVTMYDTQSRRRIWSGSAQAVIDRSLSLEGNRERIEDAVRNLLARVPSL